MKRKDVINFAPKGVNRRRRTPKYVALIVFGCVMALAASVFLILAINDFDISKALGAREAETNAENESGEALSSSPEENAVKPASKGEYVFLVLCSDKTQLLFSQLIYVNPSDAEIRIAPVSGDHTVHLEGGEMPLREAFVSTSLTALCSAFAYDNIAIDRYVHVTEENYRILLSNLGSVDVDISSYCEFNVDAVKYTFEPGMRNMTSDMLIKYLKYAGTDETREHIRATVTASVFRQHFTKSNFEKGESFFSSLINSVDSNITAFDYGSAKASLEAMLSGSVKITVVD